MSASSSAVVLSGSSSLSAFLRSLGFGRFSSLSASWVLPRFAPLAVVAVASARAAARARGLVAVVSRPGLASRPGSGWSVFFVPAFGPARSPLCSRFSPCVSSCARWAFRPVSRLYPAPAPRASWFGVAGPALAAVPLFGAVCVGRWSPVAFFLRGLGFVRSSHVGSCWSLPAGTSSPVRRLSAARAGVRLFGFSAGPCRPFLASCPWSLWELVLLASA